MNVATNLMTSPNPLKRNFDEADLHGPSLHQSQKGVHVNCNGEISVPAKCMNLCIQEPLEVPITEIVGICSPVRSSSSSVAGEVAVPANSSTSAMKPSTKRRKLTVAEQEAKKMDQEAKDRQKADEKAKQEENKRIREVEKEEKRKAREIQLKIKDEEKKRREEEKQKKEEERQKKEEEKQKKEEEKNKKEKVCFEITKAMAEY